MGGVSSIDSLRSFFTVYTVQDRIAAAVIRSAATGFGTFLFLCCDVIFVFVFGLGYTAGFSL